MEQDKQETKEKKLYLFGSWTRLLLILFLALSLFFLTAFIVVLSLTKSDGLVSVPQVKHKYLVDVYNTISRKGLKIELELVDIPSLEKGYILSQSPQPGNMVRPGQKVKLRVNRGAQFSKAPDLVGKPLNSVEGLLQSVQVSGRPANLRIGQISYVGSNEEQSGIVLSQVPKAGEEIRANSRIHLLVSKGKILPGFRMADYKGQDIDLLYEIFEIRDIQVKYKPVWINDKKFHGRVTAQYPPKGSRIQKGSTVTFSVGIFKEKYFHRIGYEVIRYRVPKNLEETPLEIFVEDNHGKRRRYRKKVRAGEMVLVIIRREGDATISIRAGEDVLKTFKIIENKERK